METKAWYLLLLMCLFAQPIQANEDYTFPIDDPIDATFTFAMLQGKNPGLKEHLSVKQPPERIPDLYLGDVTYPINKYIHRNREAPLVFILVGLGARVRGNGALFFASEFYKKGFHVVILSSTFSETFIHTASRNYFVGQARVDAKDQYKVLVDVKNHIKKQGVKVSSWNVFGFSFGAAVGAFVADLDQNKDLAIDRYILLNPPVDIMSGLQTVDDFADIKVGNRVRKAFRLLSSILTGRVRDPRRASEDFVDKNKLSAEQLKYFIGQSLRSSLGGVIFTSQQKVDLKLLKQKYILQKRREAHEYSFVEYVQIFIQSFYKDTTEGQRQWREHYQTEAFSLQRLREMNSLHSLEGTFRKDKRIVIVHNADDFLIGPRDTEFLKGSLGARFYLYPKGGHLGNVWYPENFETYLKLLGRESTE